MRACAVFQAAGSRYGPARAARRGFHHPVHRSHIVRDPLALDASDCRFPTLSRAGAGFAANLRQALFDHIGSFTYTDLDRAGTDTLITRLTSDVNLVQNGLNMALRLLLRSPFIVFGSMIMAFTIDVKSALIFAGAIPLLGIVVYGIMIISIPLYRKAQEALDALTMATRENLTGVRVIRAFSKEKEETALFDKRNEALTAMNEFVGRLSALMNPLTYVMINIATILLIRVSGARVNIGAIRQGDVVALYNYMAQMIVELIKLAALLITINKAAASAGRISEVLAIEPGMQYPETLAPSSVRENEAVRFRGVSFSYPDSGAAAVSGIEFTAMKGETIGIIGGTGSGKTTIASLIPRFYDAAEGTVEVDGRDVRSYPKGELIRKIGMVPQTAVLFEGSIRDNLKWGREEASDEELWEALSIAQAREIVEGKEGGLNFRIEQNGRNLSGGQRQRLTIARALVKKPEILIMDDSSSALDYATDLNLRRAVRTLSGRMTVFIISQRSASIRDADRILVLDDGELKGLGTHEELLRNCETYREIYSSQFPGEEAEKDA